MKRYNLLELVQEVSRRIGDKERFGLDEDLRVADVANICIATLEGLCTRHQWEFLKDRLLVPATVTDKVVVTLPSIAVRVNRVRYKVNTAMTELCYLLPEDFLNLTNNQVDNTEAVTVAGGGQVYVKTNAAPKYYTSFDEKTVVFDAYDGAVSAGIVAANVLLWADIELDTSDARVAGMPNDEWVPDIPARLNSVWLWESIAACYNDVVGQGSPSADREARRQYVMAIENEPVTQRDENKRRVTFGRRYSY